MTCTTRRFRIPFIAAALAVAAVNFSGCHCESAYALCDLVTEIFDAGGNTNISLGEVVTIRARVINQPSPVECDQTAIANATTNLFSITFDGDGSGNFVTVLDSVHIQHQLAPGELFNWSIQLSFNQPGTYLLRYAVDYGDQVVERNEDNNSGNYDFWGRPLAGQAAENARLEFLKTTNNYRSIRVTVLPDEEKEKEFAGRPAFEVVSQPWDTRVFEMNGK